jgi:hypothetical protein
LPAACIPATPYSHGTTLQPLHGPRDLTAHSHSTLHRSRSSSLHLLANESAMSWMDSNARTKKIKGVILEGDSRKMRPCKQGDPYQRKKEGRICSRWGGISGGREVSAGRLPPLLPTRPQLRGCKAQRCMHRASTVGRPGGPTVLGHQALDVGSCPCPRPGRLRLLGRLPPHLAIHHLHLATLASAPPV